MKTRSICFIFVMIALTLTACQPADKLWPSNKIGEMWVNRYGHSNSQPIWEYCSDSLTTEPGTQTVDCTVPWVDELFIGTGIRTEDKALRDALWAARTWELSIDGYAVDLPAFNVADFYEDVNGTRYEYRVWRIRLRNMPEGLHTLHYVVHVNQEVPGDPLAQTVGVYELVVNFTVEKK